MLIVMQNCTMLILKPVNVVLGSFSYLMIISIIIFIIIKQPNELIYVFGFQKYHVHYHLSLVPQCYCALVAAAVFAAAFSCHITSFENAEAVTCSLPRQNTNNFNCFWVKYHLFSVHIGNCEEHK